MTSGASRAFSLVGFALALATVGAGTAVGLAYLPVAGSYVGTLAGGVVAGLAADERLTVESGVAAVLAGLGVLVGAALPGRGVVAALVALASVDPATLLVSATLGFAVGAFGAHFGGDLREGLTEPLDEPAPRSTAAGADRDDDARELPDDARELPDDADLELDRAE